jgi:hypothetical protein
MFSRRAVHAITKASIASRIVAGNTKFASPSMLPGVPKFASPSIQRVFLSDKASPKPQVVISEPTGGSEIIKNVESRMTGVSNEIPETLKKFSLDGKVAVVTG